MLYPLHFFMHAFVLLTCWLGLLFFSQLLNHVNIRLLKKLVKLFLIQMLEPRGSQVVKAMILVLDDFLRSRLLKRLSLFKESLRSFGKFFLFLLSPLISLRNIVELSFLVLHFCFEKFFSYIQSTIPTKKSEIYLLKLLVNICTLWFKHLFIQSWHELVLFYLSFSLNSLSPKNFPLWFLFSKHEICSSIIRQKRIISLN